MQIDDQSWQLYMHEQTNWYTLSNSSLQIHNTAYDTYPFTTDPVKALHFAILA